MFYRIVHQPACSNVVCVNGGLRSDSLNSLTRGETTRLLQGSAEKCQGYIACLSDRDENLGDDVICPPSDCCRMNWTYRARPQMWHKDCREWQTDYIGAEG